MPFITVAGEQYIAQQQGANDSVDIAYFVLANIAGLGAEPSNRIEAMPDSSDIMGAFAISGSGYVNVNRVVYSLNLDSTIGDFDFNWVGLKSATGVLIAVAHITTQKKRKTTSLVLGNNLTRNFLVAYTGIQTLTAISVPASTWQIDFTTRLLQIDERERLSNYDNYGAGAFFGNGFKVTHTSGSTYNVAAGTGYVGGIRCYNSASDNLTITGLPKTVYVDASLQGDINGVSAVFSLVVQATTLANYTDNLGFKHYIISIASIASDSSVTDLRKPVSGQGSGIDADKLDGLHAASFLSHGADIPDNADLNDYVLLGFYHQNMNTQAQNGLNYPIALAGLLEVYSDGLMVYQKYTTYNAPQKIFTRTRYSGTWLAWSQLWSSTNDGANSGLDADKLDGYHASSFQQASTNRPLPIGAIIIWSGSIYAIPTNWALCDGTNGTPDLTDRFVIGAGGSRAVGLQGGSADTTLPTHSHAFKDAYYIESSGNSANAIDGVIQLPEPHVGSNATDPDNDVLFYRNTTTDNSGSSGTNKNLPPFYALAYIMLIS